MSAGMIGIPTSFEVDGEQYIAVTAGWGLDAQGVQNGIDKIRGTKTVVPKAGTLLVFKLREAGAPDKTSTVRRRRSAPRRMKGDRVAVRILRDEEATEGAIGNGGEDGAASLDERIVQHVGVVAGDPEHHAHAEWPGFGKRPDRLSQRQRDRRCLENDRARWTVRCRFETE